MNKFGIYVRAKCICRITVLYENVRREVILGIMQTIINNLIIYICISADNNYRGLQKFTDFLCSKTVFFVRTYNSIVLFIFLMMTSFFFMLCRQCIVESRPIIILCIYIFVSDAMKDLMWCSDVLHGRDYYIRRTNWFSNIPFQKIYILGIDVTL